MCKGTGGRDEPPPAAEPPREPFEPTPNEDEERATTSAPDEPLPAEEELVRREPDDRRDAEHHRTGDETLARLEEQRHDPGKPMHKPPAGGGLGRLGEEPPIPPRGEGSAARGRQAQRTLGATRATLSVAAQLRKMATRARGRLRRR